MRNFQCQRICQDMRSSEQVHVYSLWAKLSTRISLNYYYDLVRYSAGLFQVFYNHGPSPADPPNHDHDPNYADAIPIAKCRLIESNPITVLSDASDAPKAAVPASSQVFCQCP